VFFKLGPNQERWLKALESGDFKQGRGALYNRDSNTYCCLGVAAALFLPPGHNFGDRTLWNGSSSFLIRHDILGLYDAAGRFAPERPQKDFIGLRSLSCANDEGRTFKQIAAFCRANPEDVFERSV